MWRYGGELDPRSEEGEGVARIRRDGDLPALDLAAALLAASPISYACPCRSELALTPVISDGKIPGQIVLTRMPILVYISKDSR